MGAKAKAKRVGTVKPPARKKTAAKGTTKKPPARKKTAAKKPPAKPPARKRGGTAKPAKKAPPKRTAAPAPPGAFGPIPATVPAPSEAERKGLPRIRFEGYDPRQGRRSKADLERLFQVAMVRGRKAWRWVPPETVVVQFGGRVHEHARFSYKFAKERPTELKAPRFEFTWRLCRDYRDEDVVATMVHELCHYRRALLSDKEESHDAEFCRLMRLVDPTVVEVPSTCALAQIEPLPRPPLAVDAGRLQLRLWRSGVRPLLFWVPRGGEPELLDGDGELLAHLRRYPPARLAEVPVDTTVEGVPAPTPQFHHALDLAYGWGWNFPGAVRRSFAEILGLPPGPMPRQRPREGAPPPAAPVDAVPADAPPSPPGTAVRPWRKGGDPVLVVRHDRVWWVGRGLELPPGVPLRQSRSEGPLSREGVALSVSQDPSYWATLLSLPGPAWQLARLDGSPGRFAMFGPALFDVATRWAVAEGWVTVTAARRVSFYDPSERRWVEDMLLREESESVPLDWKGRPMYLAWEMRHSHELTPTAKLRARFVEWFATVRAVPLAASVESEVVNLWLAAHRPELDGLWHADRVDASRAAILPHALPRWGAAARRAVADLPPSPRWG